MPSEVATVSKGIHRGVTIAWHIGFGGMDSADVPFDEAVEFLAELFKRNPDWVQIVGMGER